MKILKNMAFMMGGVGVGYCISKYEKDIKKVMKKGKKEVMKTIEEIENM